MDLERRAHIPAVKAHEVHGLLDDAEPDVALAVDISAGLVEDAGVPPPGGTAFKDGEPNLAGTLLGALIIGTMANGLTILNVSYYYQDIATGLIILAAVIITSVQKSHKN